MKYGFEKDSGRENVRIHGLHGEKSTDGKKFLLTWQWPENEEYHFCFLVRVSESMANQNLEASMILQEGREQNLIIIDKHYPDWPQIELEEEGFFIYAFPAHYSNDGYFVLNQKGGGNRVKVPPAPKRIHVVVASRLVYRKTLGLWRGQPSEKVVQIRLQSPELFANGILIYRCEGGTRSNRRYGIDLASFGSQMVEIRARPSEKVVIEPSPTQSQEVDVVVDYVDMPN